MGNYVLRCTACGRDHADDGLRVHCDASHGPSFLRTVYGSAPFKAHENERGILRYKQWLPLRNEVEGTGLTATFQSATLNRALDTPNLWIAFNGYWPQRGAHLTTATFKELEALAVVGRFPRDGTVLVTASAGNTAVSLASACSRAGIPALIVVPQRVIPALRFSEPLADSVKFIGVENGTYDDAIAFARAVATIPGFSFEGGAANVARRDGIGTTMLRSVEVMGSLPEYYLQPVGSGAGALAAHEAALRLIEDGLYGTQLPRLYLVQNSPSAPIDASWKLRSPVLVGLEDDAAQRAATGAMAAQVLGIRVPPYAISGGLFGALTQSCGETGAVTNEETRRSSALFTRLEGIDIEPAAAVALAGLQAGLASGAIERDARILLHLTGGGREASLELRPYSARANLLVQHVAAGRDRAAEHAARLFAA